MTSRFAELPKDIAGEPTRRLRSAGAWRRKIPSNG